jgi:acetaldehyde dehydrogenase/alcohol dehydrogenase
MTVFQDLSNRTNPRMPLVAELTALLRLGYYGEGTEDGRGGSAEHDGRKAGGVMA